MQWQKTHERQKTGVLDDSGWQHKNRRPPRFFSRGYLSRGRSHLRLGCEFMYRPETQRSDVKRGWARKCWSRAWHNSSRAMHYSRSNVSNSDSQDIKAQPQCLDLMVCMSCNRTARISNWDHDDYEVKGHLERIRRNACAPTVLYRWRSE